MIKSPEGPQMLPQMGGHWRLLRRWHLVSRTTNRPCGSGTICCGRTGSRSLSPRLQAWARRHRVQAQGLALHFRPHARLAQVQESGCPGGEAGGRGGVEPTLMLSRLRLLFLASKKRRDRPVVQRTNLERKASDLLTTPQPRGGKCAGHNRTLEMQRVGRRGPPQSD